jgi:uncharacterized protein
MNKKDMLIAQELKHKISTIAPLIDFRIFGSRARGDANEYSDMDVFIEVEILDAAMEKKISYAAWETGFNNGSMVICPLVFTRHELEETAERSSDIVKNILREGVRV